MNTKNKHEWLPMAGGLIAVGCMVLLAAFLFLNRYWKTVHVAESIIPWDRGKEIKLCFYHDEEKRFVFKSVRLGSQVTLQEQITALVKKMCEKPAGQNIAGTSLPLTMEVRSVYLRKNGLLILDFEKSVQYNQTGSVLDELISVYSLLRTLTVNYPEIKQVKFLVGGQESDVLASQADVTHPLQLDDFQWQ